MLLPQCSHKGSQIEGTKAFCNLFFENNGRIVGILTIFKVLQNAVKWPQFGHYFSKNKLQKAFVPTICESLLPRVRLVFKY